MTTKKIVSKKIKKNFLSNLINKKNWNSIESAHSAQLSDQNKIIEELNEELVKIYNEYLNLSNVLQEMNDEF